MEKEEGAVTQISACVHVFIFLELTQRFSSQFTAVGGHFLPSGSEKC